MHLVVGLGNPGRKYEGTRHNVGFLVVDRLASRSADSVQTKQFGALVGKALVGGQSAVLAKPQGFMNRSGQPVVSLRGYYKLDNVDVVVVHDDLDLPFGQVRIKEGGGHGGHNGLRDISRALGGGSYLRVRVGLGRPPEGWDAADFVLGKWTKGELQDLEQVLDLACDAVEGTLHQGVLAAMNQFNVRPGLDRQEASASSRLAGGAR
ncbi:MAG: PTH1 family peptidyl-tRNA hydrolase [Kiritimatiellia bacterium]|jgi:PTH1 family peptidyl-tRNA hydrolase